MDLAGGWASLLCGFGSVWLFSPTTLDGSGSPNLRPIMCGAVNRCLADRITILLSFFFVLECVMTLCFYSSSKVSCFMVLCYLSLTSAAPSVGREF